MVAITPLPAPAPGIAGVINVEGEITPVMSLTARLSEKPAQEPAFEQKLILCRCEQHSFAFLADEIVGLDSFTGEQSVAPEELPSSSQLSGLLKGPGGLVLAPILAKLLPVEESFRREAT